MRLAMTPDIDLDEEVRPPADRSWGRKFADALRGL
jgi:hypothetical protein